MGTVFVSNNDQLPSLNWFLFCTSLRLPRSINIHDVFIRNWMPQSHPLRNVPCACAPNKRILERILESAVYPVAHVFNGAVASYNQCLAKVWIGSFPLGVNTDELELFPAPVDHILDSQVQLATHDYCVVFSGELVQKVKRDAVDLVVDVQAPDVLAVIFHNNVDEVVDSDVFISDKHLAVEDLVVTEDVINHLLVNVVRWRLEGNFHAASLFDLEVDISAHVFVS